MDKLDKAYEAVDLLETLGLPVSNEQSNAIAQMEKDYLRDEIIPLIKQELEPMVKKMRNQFNMKVVYSKETASEMARACRDFYDADLGIGVTGSFGNVDPKNKDSVPGEVYFAISSRDGTESFFCEVPEQPSRLYYKLYMANVIADEINKKVR